ncbi:MAG: hypothetical protein WDO15_08620 [Bacteroidota bacterium]
MILFCGETIVGMIVLTGLLSGTYPAFMLSSLSIAKIIKGPIERQWRSLLSSRAGDVPICHFNFPDQRHDRHLAAAGLHTSQGHRDFIARI